MALLIFLILVAVPVAEIALFIQAGEIIGLGPTLALVILTAFIGTALLRYQGLRALRRAEAALQQNELPVEEVLTGICLLLAGALLLTPGFLTDSVGFALFVPQIRTIIGAGFFRLLLAKGQTTIWAGGGKEDHPMSNVPPDGPVIDGDFHEVQGDAPDKRTPKIG
jgi:UPF0716 protein FxsA